MCNEIGNNMITKISIKNIKGYNDSAKPLNMELNPNRVNIIYAPNGSGKTSLATAFNSLKSNKLKVSKEMLYKKDETLEPEIRLTIDNEELVADSKQNNISPKLNCCVINCHTAVSTISKNVGGKYHSISGYLDITDIVIKETIPDREYLKFSIQSIRNEFGVNGKVLPNNFNDIKDVKFWKKLISKAELLDRFLNAKTRIKIINDIKQLFNGCIGTKKDIEQEIQDSVFDNLFNDSVYKEIMKYINNIINLNNSKEKFYFFYELLYFWKESKDKIKKAIKYDEYKEFKDGFDKNLFLIGSTWKNIHTEEKDKQLIVRFPHADEISNGQRDILTFVVDLLKFKTSIKENKKYLLIIDEIFDYLDDANIIAAQYFLSTLLKGHKGNIYLCILTHLSPNVFRNYLFKKKNINIVDMLNTKPIANKRFKEFICLRTFLQEQKGEEEKKLYDNLCNYLFHYNTQSVEYEDDLQKYKTKHKDLDCKMGNTEYLHKKLIEQVNKYLSNQPKYDPYAVAMALRLKVEKIAYNMLTSMDLKDEFMKRNTTQEKFQFCIDNKIPIPETLNIVNAIHNEANHLESEEQDVSAIYKLQNNVIKDMIKKIFEWDDKTNYLTPESID